MKFIIVKYFICIWELLFAFFLSDIIEYYGDKFWFYLVGIIEHLDFCFLNIADFAQIAEMCLCRRKFTVLIQNVGV